ncbi:ABC transporter ATP-binding protein [Paenibacillus elgii]|uniref:ABC transporter ATP-binding protein n=1 Tax=Paenibacillus elgii TaxID=189691 RepID=A0A2T6FRX5_9BACL|nr:ABC transporter ATP-binding protein [Paenibacillus elgii]PUA34637.1 ABC transporter ATP-binding protein [Paenibacillus elgii]
MSENKNLNVNFWKVYLWALSFFRVQIKFVLGLVFCGLIATAVEMLLPKYLQLFIDTIYPDKNMELFIISFIILPILIILMFYAKTLINRFHNIIGEQSSSSLQYASLNHLYELGLEYYENNTIGETFDLFNTSIKELQKLYRELVPEIIKQTIILFVCLLIMFQMSLILTCTIVASCFLYFLTGPFFEKRASVIVKEAAKKLTELNQGVFNGISAIPDVLIYSRVKWSISKILNQHVLYSKYGMKRTLWLYLRGAVRRGSIAIGSLGVFYIGAILVRSDSMSVGEFVSYTTYSYIVVRAFTEVITCMTEQKILIAQAEKLYIFHQRRPQLREPSAQKNLYSFRGDINVKNVKFGYNGNEVLKDISFCIPSGKTVALVGESGGGKTTVSKLIGRLYDSFGGSICLDEVNINEIPRDELLENMGFVFQDTYLFGKTIMENIRFGKPNASDEEVYEAAKSAHAHEFIKELSEGYNTLVGERGIKLSGGQKQRIAIARMFIKNPKIIILDEATSALDNNSEKEVQAAMISLLKGRTTLVIAHRLSTIIHADKIIVLQAGRIIEEGSYEELINNNGAFLMLLNGGVY